MHILNKILVNVKALLGDTADMDRSEVMNMVRDHAEQETDYFYEDAYDWRETDTAGRWAQTYPENVLLGSENPEQLREEIVDAETAQKEELDTSLKMLEGYARMPFNELVQTLWERRGSLPVDASSFAADMATYHIKKIAKLLSGEYFYDSFFYDANEYTARISPNTYKKIQENPGDWALVFFDQHF